MSERPPGLERLWAAWRSAYVGAAGQGLPDADGSVFSRILASGLPDEETLVVWRGEHAFAILNLYPYTSGHVMVMPYREVAELEALGREEARDLWGGVTDAVRALKAAYQPDGINVGINLGTAAGAGVPGHLHVHVVPRWAADSNFMTSVAEARVLPESLGVSWARVRAAWPADG